jgi:cyanophycinase
LGLAEDTAALIGPDDVIEVMGSGAVTIVDPSQLEYSSMDSVRERNPVCLVGLRVHSLVEGWSFDLERRTAQSAAGRGTG